MKTIALILGGITAITLLATMYSYAAPDLTALSSAQAQFQEFKQRHGRIYSSLSEQLYRFQVFQSNLRVIDEVNADSRNTYTAAVNQFADMTFEEFSTFYLTIMPTVSAGKCTDHPSGNVRVPDTWNWNDSGKVQKPKNQANCGSCWAFSAIGAVESALAIKTGQLPNLSEQELVDCSKSYGNEGCNGGLMNFAFDYILDHKIHSEQEYPYAGRNQQCKADSLGEGSYSISGCVKATATIDGLVEAIAVQPVSVAFHVTNTFMFYHGGIYNPWFCTGQPNHGVLAVGFNKTDKTPFYIVKNSWGASWGESGYFRIAMGKGEGTCKIAGNGFNYYPLA
jgi:C1A family cysteine protease